MTDRFVIYKTLPDSNVFTLTIKQQNSTLPMEITPSDSFTATLKKLSDGTSPTGVTLTIPNPTNGADNVIDGKVELTIAGTLSSLVSERGTKADRYYLRPTYKLIIECDTTNNGRFIAKVDEVYVEA